MAALREHTLLEEGYRSAARVEELREEVDEQFSESEDFQPEPLNAIVIFGRSIHDCFRECFEIHPTP